MKDFFDKTLFLYWLFHYKLFFDVWRQAEETPTIDLEVKKGSEHCHKTEQYMLACLSECA